MKLSDKPQTVKDQDKKNARNECNRCVNSIGLYIKVAQKTC